MVCEGGLIGCGWEKGHGPRVRRYRSRRANRRQALRSRPSARARSIRCTLVELFARMSAGTAPAALHGRPQRVRPRGRTGVFGGDREARAPADQWQLPPPEIDWGAVCPLHCSSHVAPVAQLTEHELVQVTEQLVPSAHVTLPLSPTVT